MEDGDTSCREVQAVCSRDSGVTSLTLFFPEGAVLIAVDCSALRVVVVEEYLVISLVRSGALNRDTVVVSLLGVFDGAAVGFCAFRCHLFAFCQLSKCLIDVLDDVVLFLAKR